MIVADAPSGTRVSTSAVSEAAARRFTKEPCGFSMVNIGTAGRLYNVKYLDITYPVAEILLTYTLLHSNPCTSTVSFVPLLSLDTMFAAVDGSWRKFSFWLLTGLATVA